MNSDLTKKREDLARLEASLALLEKQHKENLRTLQNLVSENEAAGLCRAGQITESEYASFVQARGALEISVRCYPEMRKTTVRAISNTRADIRKIYLVAVWKQVVGLFKGLLGGIAISCAFFPMIPILVAFYFLEQHGVVSHTTATNAMFFSLVLQMLVVVIVLIREKRKK